MLVVLFLTLGVWFALNIPPFGVALCGVLLAVQIVFIVARVVITPRDIIHLAEPDENLDPNFSIPVKIQNKPSAMVAKTLQALARQGWSMDQYGGLLGRQMQFVGADKFSAAPKIAKRLPFISFRPVAGSYACPYGSGGMSPILSAIPPVEFAIVAPCRAAGYTPAFFAKGGLGGTSLVTIWPEERMKTNHKD